jgi:hypothetical protein
MSILEFRTAVLPIPQRWLLQTGWSGLTRLLPGWS